MFKITNNEIRITRGDSASFNVVLKTDEGEAYMLPDGSIVTFTVKRDTGQPKYLIQKTNTDSTSFTISPEDTSALKYGEYVYDVQLTVGGDVSTVVVPTPFIVTEEVTW